MSKEYEHKVRTLIPGTMYKSAAAKEFMYSCLKELKEIKAIEEEFSIDLIKLLNAKKVYYMAWNKDSTGFVIEETYKLFINLTNRTIEFFEDEYSEFTFDLELKNYGKNDVWCGWALTREELE